MKETIIQGEKPADIPKVLYKYRDWDDENHRKALEYNEIFLASPSHFNDPFDNKIPINFFLLDTVDKKERFVRIKAIKHFEQLHNPNIDLPAELDLLREKLNTVSKYQVEYEKSLFQSYDERIGIFSLSKVWNNILMWSYYANSHRGFCIGYNEHYLRSLTINEEKLFWRGCDVSYEDEFPIIDPLFEPKNIEEFIAEGILKSSTKHEGWKHEEEFRAFRYFTPKPARSNEDRVIILPNETIEEVILGLGTPEEVREDIISIAKSKKFKIYQIEKVPFRFELKRTKIL